jgi:hypothetical protein
MSAIVVAGNTSGSVTLDAPDVAGTTVITLPATSGTMALSGGAGSFTTVVASSTIKGASTIAVGNATPSASGAGITFPATQSASTDANTLDDYEEGTWTPVLKDNSGNTATMSVQQGFYTKIGNIVNVWWQVEWTNKAALVGVYPIITGLPFTSRTNTGGYGYFGACVLSSSASNIVGSLEANTTNVGFLNSATNAIIQVPTINSTGRSMCSLTYFV